jgi:uncharacterized protein (DUF1778 family)
MSKSFGTPPGAVITIRLPAAEKERLVKAAVADQRNLSSFLRLAGLRLAEEVLADERRMAA